MLIAAIAALMLLAEPLMNTYLGIAVSYESTYGFYPETFLKELFGEAFGGMLGLIYRLNLMFSQGIYGLGIAILTVSLFILAFKPQWRFLPVIGVLLLWWNRLTAFVWSIILKIFATIYSNNQYNHIEDYYGSRYVYDEVFIKAREVFAYIAEFFVVLALFLLLFTTFLHAIKKTRKISKFVGVLPVLSHAAALLLNLLSMFLYVVTEKSAWTDVTPHALMFGYYALPLFVVFLFVWLGILLDKRDKKQLVSDTPQTVA